MKKILLLVLIPFCWVHASAVQTVALGYEYNDELNTATAQFTLIETDDLTVNSIIIPETVSNSGKTYTVCRIDGGPLALMSRLLGKPYDYSIVTIVIPKTITFIGQYGFLGFGNLQTIIMPEDLDVSECSLFLSDENYKYQVLNGHEVEITKCVSENKDIEIPRIVKFGNEFQITSIKSSVFSGFQEITSVTCPENLDISHAGISFSTAGFRYRILSNNEVKLIDVLSKDVTSCVIPRMITAGNIFSVISIGDNAFSDCSNLKSAVIGANVESIGANAFSDCSSLSKITCYAVEPPTVDASSFSNYNGYLTIPCDNFEAYDIHAVWGTFKHVDCIGSETVELTKDEVVVTPEKTEALFSVPINESADSYTLTIKNNGVTFCTLTFNAQGQLANIDFSTTKSYELKAGVSGYQFTVTGLSEATNYGYSFKALASNKSVLKEYSGSFTTKNADGTGGSVQGGGEGTLAVDAVSNATAVTIVNGQILVNGEAPAFVITIIGQKIANKNLKSGLYFVVVNGKTVKVSVQ